MSLRVLSLGAGVQSSTLLLMMEAGEIPPADVAVFADTQWEPPAVYDWLDYLDSITETEIVKVTAGDIRDDALNRASRFASMPLYLTTDKGEGMLRRQCTKEYKIAPLRRWIRAQGIDRFDPATLVFGISFDELQRMRDSDRQYLIHDYPLVDGGITRQDCLLWMERAGLARPPRSACIGCPYHTDAEWRRQRDEDPESWADSIDFDRRIRLALPRIKGTVYLHRQRVPLDQVDLRTQKDHGQLSFLDECEGMCGV